MASAVASKGVPAAALIKELLASPSASGKASASARRLSIPKLFSADPSDDSSDEDLSIPKLFSGGVLDLFDEATKLPLVQALKEEGGAAASRTSSVSPRGWWVSKVDADAVQLKVAMAGLGKEHVKMQAEKDVLVIKGEEGDKDSEGDDGKGPARYKYTHRIRLSSQAFKMDQIKAEMKNGMLILTVPKIKDEERKDVFEIKVE